MANDKDDDRIVISIISDDDETPKKNNVKKATPAPKRPQEAPKNKNKNYRNGRQDKKNAKKIFKNRTGGFFLKSSYKDEIKKKGLTVTEGIKIRDIVKKEIDNGKLNSESVDNRIDELITEYAKIVKKEKEARIAEIKAKAKAERKRKKKVEKDIDELFESKEIKRYIKIYELTEPKVSKVKRSLTELITTSDIDKYSEQEIKTLAQTKLLEERKKMREEEADFFKRRWFENLKKIITESCPDIELTDKETTYIKQHIENNELKGSVETMQNQLKRIAENVISNRQIIGEYDSTGTLREDGGFTNYGPPLDLHQEKHLKKAPDKYSEVFIKINDDRLILTETSQGNYFNENAIFSKRTFFFKDIILLNKGIRIPVVGLSGREKDYFHRPGIEFTLINNEKLVLSFDNEEKIDVLYDKWEAYKENQENEVSSSPQESNDSIGEDILKYADLYEKGLLTEEEFTALKKKLLGL